MKAHLKSGNGRLLIEVEGASVKELFERIAEVQEILDADDKCGACGSHLIRFRVRHVKTFDYFELHCEACGARLAFGQLKDGTGLYPRRKDKAGKELANRGWSRFITAGEEPPS